MPNPQTARMAAAGLLIPGEPLPDIPPECVDGPCTYRAGSAKKVAVLAARYEAGKPLWDRGDSEELVESDGDFETEDGNDE